MGDFGNAFRHGGAVNPDADWRPIWQRIEAEFLDEGRGWTKTYLYEVTGISEATFTKMEKYGTPLKRPAKRAALLAGLGWAPGSFDAILNGGNPIPIDPAEAATPNGGVESRVERLERELERLTGLVAGLVDEVDALGAEVERGVRVRRSRAAPEEAARAAGS